MVFCKLYESIKSESIYSTHNGPNQFYVTAELPGLHIYWIFIKDIILRTSDIRLISENSFE